MWLTRTVVLERVGPFLKVGTDAVGQDCGLPDVDEFALLVPEQIDAGLVREMVEFGLEFSRSSHQLSAFRSQGKNAVWQYSTARTPGQLIELADADG